jgi:polyisoprenoid-binding protein YceI
MQTRPLALVMTITMLGAAPLAAADEAPKSYAVDGAASEVVYHLVHKLHKVDGRTHRVDGRAMLTPDGRGQVELRLPPDSFDSGNVNRDALMKEVLDVAT